MKWKYMEHPVLGDSDSAMVDIPHDAIQIKILQANGVAGSYRIVCWLEPMQTGGAC